MTQPIPLTNPRRVSVPLSDFGKKGGAYRFSKSVKPYLTAQGWQFVDETRDYVQLIPPDGITKPFLISLEVPDRAQIERLATDRHVAGELWFGKIGVWTAYYAPVRKDGMRTTQVNPFTDERGKTKTEDIPAMFHVGEIDLWAEWVEFRETGQVYFDDPRPVSAPKTQPDLFGDLPSAADAPTDDQQDHAQQGATADDLEGAAFPEGRVAYRLHRFRERNKAVIDQAKSLAKKRHGRLLCQVCDFDFEAVYGAVGKDYIEGHHTRPLSELAGETETLVEEIALVCANCHRMLHRRRPWLTMTKLKNLVEHCQHESGPI
jgi:hypothetical protein